MNDHKKIIIGCIIGTRPEVIKMAPIIFKLKSSSWAEVFVINTAQHRSLLDDMLGLFDLTPDADLDCMINDQSLGELTGNLCKKLDALVKNNRFDVLLAAGDTTTVFASSLIAFIITFHLGILRLDCEPTIPASLFLKKLIGY